MAPDHVVKISNAERLRQVHDIADTQAVQLIGSRMAGESDEPKANGAGQLLSLSAINRLRAQISVRAYWDTRHRSAVGTSL